MNTSQQWWEYRILTKQQLMTSSMVEKEHVWSIFVLYYFWTIILDLKWE